MVLLGVFWKVPNRRWLLGFSCGDDVSWKKFWRLVEYFFVVSWGQILNDGNTGCTMGAFVLCIERCVDAFACCNAFVFDWRANCACGTREGTLTTRTQTHTHKRE